MKRIALVCLGGVLAGTVYAQTLSPGVRPPHGAAGLDQGTIHGPLSVIPGPIVIGGNGSPTIGDGYTPAASGLYIDTQPTGAANSSTAILNAGGWAQPQNFIHCQDSINAASANFGGGGVTADVPCLAVYSVLGGGSAVGSRNALSVSEKIVSNTGTEAGNDFYIGMTSAITADANVGGKSGAPTNRRGNLYGIASEVTMTGNASYWGDLMGAEFDVSAQSGSAPFSKAGVLVSAYGNDHDHGSAVDTAFWVTNTAGRSAGFNTGLYFQTGGTYQPITKAGTYIYSDAASVTNGIDFHDVTCSGNYILMGPKFDVDCNGNVKLDNTVTASGASLAVNYGSDGTMFGVCAVSGCGTPAGRVVDYIYLTGAVSAGADIANVAINSFGADASLDLTLNAKGQGAVVIGSGAGLKLPGSTAHGVLIGEASHGAIIATSAGGVGTLLTGQGSSADPRFSATPSLGASGTPGSLTMGNAVSGTVTLQPVAGALGRVFATLPANTGTIAELNASQSWTAGQAVAPAAEGTQSPDGTLTMDFSRSNHFAARFGSGDLTIANPSNIKPGQEGCLALTQDGGGSRTVSWGAYWKWSNGIAPTLTPAASASDLICWHAVSTTVLAAHLAIANYK